MRPEDVGGGGESALELSPGAEPVGEGRVPTFTRLNETSSAAPTAGTTAPEVLAARPTWVLVGCGSVLPSPSPIVQAVPPALAPFEESEPGTSGEPLLLLLPPPAGGCEVQEEERVAVAALLLFVP